MTLAAPLLGSPYLATASLEADAFAAIRRRMMLEHCKSDAQVGDGGALAPFALTMPAASWRLLAALAESLFAEAIAAERELLERPELHATLGLPRWLRRMMRDVEPSAHSPRVMRFDFHWTRDDGWRISEVNADVPGGYGEASALPTLFAPHVPGTRAAGDPLLAWVDAIARAARHVAGGERATVGLISAPGFMEDHQVVASLCRGLTTRHPTLAVRPLTPRQLCWRDDFAQADGQPLHALVRFCQAEWLRGLAPRAWHRLAGPSRTRILQPLSAALVEGKRWPLVWDALRSTPLDAWRRLLPETRDPRAVRWRTDDRWLLKSAFCNNGDDVCTPDGDARRWRRGARSARWRPGRWIAQRRFVPMPLATPIGDVFPCVGVYAIDGVASGAYLRLGRGPIVDYRALDAALLIEEDA